MAVASCLKLPQTVEMHITSCKLARVVIPRGVYQRMLVGYWFCIVDARRVKCQKLIWQLIERLLVAHALLRTCVETG